jgi:hypothetical protein
MDGRLLRQRPYYSVVFPQGDRADGALQLSTLWCKQFRKGRRARASRLLLLDGATRMPRRCSSSHESAGAS